MPTVAQSWFATHFGDRSWEDPATWERDPAGRVVPHIGPAKRYDTTLPTPPGIHSSVDDWVKYQTDLQAQQYANSVNAEANRMLDAQKAAQQGSAAQKMNQERAAQAALRVRLRAAMTPPTVHTSTDWTKLNPPADVASGTPMITLPGQAKDLGRSITNKDPFWTGQFETKTNPIYGHPTNKWEAGLDMGPQIGTEVVKSPIVAHAIYRDSAGEAMRYAQTKRFDQKTIQGWQAFFVNSGVLKPGAFQFGAWDSNTQNAMYQMMGQANAMGTTVDSVKSGMEATWRSLGGSPASGFGMTSGGAAAQPRDVTQKVFSITSLAKGGEILRAYLQQELGRDPNSAEIAAYVRLLNGKERKNPTITNTHYSASGNASTSIVKDANVDPGDTAHSYLTGDMKAELQARQTMEYMNALAGM